MEKSNKKRLITIIVILVLGLIVGGIIYGLNQKATTNSEKTDNSENMLEGDIQNNNNENIQSNTIVYEKLNQNLNEGDEFFVTKAIANKDNTYTIQGVVYTKNFIITKEQVSKIKENNGLKIDEEFYSIKEPNEDEVEKYGKKVAYNLLKTDGNAMYSLVKDENSDNYEMIILADTGECWRRTNQYKEITVSANMDIVNDSGYVVEDGKKYSVESVLKNIKEVKPIQFATRLYVNNRRLTPKFDNGNCISLHSSMNPDTDLHE